MVGWERRRRARGAAAATHRSSAGLLPRLVDLDRVLSQRAHVADVGVNAVVHDELGPAVGVLARPEVTALAKSLGQLCTKELQLPVAGAACRQDCRHFLTVKSGLDVRVVGPWHEAGFHLQRQRLQVVKVSGGVELAITLRHIYIYTIVQSAR